jgi:prepilin-type N-terminal cleavage/methylation domain-containing protein
MRGHKSNSRGGAFTLVEMVIVVILLGVLAAIVAISFSDTSEEAELATCLTNLKNIQGAMNLYYVRNGSYPTTTEEFSDAYPTLPTCPLDGAYDWNLSSYAYHIRCSGQHTPESNHVCIHEDRPPTVNGVADDTADTTAGPPPPRLPG